MAKTVVEVGSIFNSKSYGPFEIIKFLHRNVYNQCTVNHYLVKFIETGYECEASSVAIRSGLIKDKYVPTLYGTGYLGNAKIKDSPRLYRIWCNMIERCYSKKCFNYTMYGLKGITVDKRWHSFENFLQDVTKLEGFNEALFANKKIQLDKDKKQQERQKENRVYSRDTCLWLPSTENMSIAIKERGEKKGHYYFEATSPSGEVFIGHNQLHFSKEHGLSNSGISGCLNGKISTHKGWKFKYVTSNTP